MGTCRPLGRFSARSSSWCVHIHTPRAGQSGASEGDTAKVRELEGGRRITVTSHA